jgi:peptide/nickel transport system permease protein
LSQQSTKRNDIFIMRRLVLSIPLVVLVSIMVFALIHLIPGDPATVFLGQEATPAFEAVSFEL